MALGQSPCASQPVEEAYQLLRAHRPLRNNGDGFMGGIIDNGQTVDDTALCCPVKDEVHRPHLIGGHGALQGMTVRNRNLLPLAPLYLQTGFGIEPIHAL